MAKAQRQVEPLLYSIDETAAALGISRGKIYSEIKERELQTTRIGDRQFTTREQQLDYVARKQSSRRLTRTR